MDSREINSGASANSGVIGKAPSIPSIPGIIQGVQGGIPSIPTTIPSVPGSIPNAPGASGVVGAPSVPGNLYLPRTYKPNIPPPPDKSKMIVPSPGAVAQDIYKKNKYSGLSNQGGTCYLNSLLQSLFMTPEFRKNLLLWKYNQENHGARVDCIPFQLQKLFSRMQLKVRFSEETKELTKSFQWNSSEVFQQQDIQELCRVLFDAIEQSLDLSDSSFINDLYEGQSGQVVKCLTCGYESERVDKFLDISLPIRNDWDKIYNNSLEMAFYNFLKPEKLEGGNQYNCSKCDKKVDALMFKRFSKVPNILFLQLNRFEYDPMTDSRKKIFDKVTFPQLLNFNDFVLDFEKIKEKYTEETFKVFQERIFKDDDGQEKIEEYLKQGNLVYELYSIVIHSGSAFGGHYYAYIKSFEDGKWYNFNDANVSEISSEAVQSLFGTSEKSGHGPTGYVLMYRKATLQKIEKVEDDIIDPNLKAIIDEENEKIKEEERKWKEKFNNITLQVVLNDQTLDVPAKKTTLVKELKNTLLELQKDAELKPSNARIRAINAYSGKKHEAFENEDMTLEEAGIVAHNKYILEVKADEEAFEEYNPNIMDLFVYIWPEDNKCSEEKDITPVILKIDRTLPYKIFRDKILEELRISPENLDNFYIFKKQDLNQNNYSTTDIKFTEDNIERSVMQNCLYENSKIYIEKKSEDWKEVGSKFSKMFSEKASNLFFRFNTPLDPTKIKEIKLSSYKFEHEVMAKKNETIRALKERISEYLDVDINSFIIKKHNYNGIEVKQLSDRIDTITHSNINIYLELGKPANENDLSVVLKFVEYDFGRYLIFPYKTTHIGTFNIDTTKSVKQVKEMFIEEVNKKLETRLDSEYVLLRYSQGERPTKILHNDIIIKNLGLFDNVKLLIQEYKYEKLSFTPNQISISIREWFPDEWRISEPVEMLVTQDILIQDLMMDMYKHFPHIGYEDFEFFRIVSPLNVYFEEMVNFTFENMMEKGDSKISSYPFFINADGIMLLIKDRKRVYREPTEDERKIYSRPAPSNNFCNYNSNQVGVVLYDPLKDVSTQGDKGGLVSSMVKRLEQSGIPHSTGGVKKKPERAKEQGLKITVKKNEVQGSPTKEEAKEEKTDENSDGTFIKPVRDFSALSSENQTKETKQANKIDIQISATYGNDEDDGFTDGEIRPLW